MKINILYVICMLYVCLHLALNIHYLTEDGNKFTCKNVTGKLQFLQFFFYKPVSTIKYLIYKFMVL